MAIPPSRYLCGPNCQDLDGLRYEFGNVLQKSFA